MESSRQTLRLAKVAGLALALGVGTLALACESDDGELQVLDVEPRSGHTSGMQPVKIIGKNWRRDINYDVFFGAKRAERATIFDDHTLVVISPQQEEAATVDVVVSPDVGPAYRIHDGFRFEDQGGNVMEQVGEPEARPDDEREERFCPRPAAPRASGADARPRWPACTNPPSRPVCPGIAHPAAALTPGGPRVDLTSRWIGIGREGRIGREGPNGGRAPTWSRRSVRLGRRGSPRPVVAARGGASRRQRGRRVGRISRFLAPRWRSPARRLLSFRPRVSPTVRSARRSPPPRRGARGGTWHSQRGKRRRAQRDQRRGHEHGEAGPS
ncbi:MAG: IPT/TIG domain-containing protein [Sandaracinaceae bacterium]